MSASLSLVGHKDAEARFLHAYRGGRLHHGWIIEGPSGIGKSRLARRFAATLLGDEAHGDDAAPTHVLEKVLSGGHPDLHWVTRELNERGALRQDITIDQIRDLNGFFNLKPALGGWRVGVVDALDDMNRNGMNALLKTLEEPPPHAILLLVSHRSAPLLATVRSRCQTLRLQRLSEAETREVLSGLELDGTQAEAAGALARGRPGYGVSLSTAPGLAAARAARDLLQNIHRPADAMLSAAHASASMDETALHAFADECLSWVEQKAETEPDWSDCWFALSRLMAEHAQLHMTTAQTAASLISTLQTTGRGG